MNASDHKKIRQLFDEYLQMYASRDDSLTTYFSDDFSGFTGGGDFLVKKREEWVAITRQDFAQVKDSLRIELKDLAIQSLSDTIAVTTGFFNIHLPIEDHILSRETARLVLIFRKESTGWKISHSSISIPYHLVRAGEVYPLQELVERNNALEEQVAVRTMLLSEANDNLLRINEQLAKEIEEHMQTEEALRVSKEQLKVIFDASEAGIIMVSPDGHIEFGNKRMAEMFGVSVQELIDTSYTDYLHEAEKLIGDEAMRQLMQGIVQSISVERHYVSIDGTDFWGHLSGRRLENTDGGLRALVGVIADITDCKCMEEKLREREEQYRALVELSPDAIYIRAGGKMIFTNIEGAKLFGVGHPEDIYGREALDMVHPDYRDLVQQRMAETLQSGKPNPPVEIILVRQDGSQVPVEVASVAFRYHGENAFLTIARDITGRKRLQEEMLKTQQLESLGVLAGGLAHDFNNILSVILGNVSLARIQVNDPVKVTQRLESAETAAVRAKDLTRQLLTFARGGDPVKNAVNVGSLLKEAAAFAINGSSVKCQFILGNDLWKMEADEGQISQVVHNLVLNAVQAMANGGTLIVTAKNANSQPEGKNIVLISVADTGTGIHQDYIQRIFEPYFTTKQQGSGLGLATCYSIIKKHGGDINVESTLGLGTTFHISLPAMAQIGETVPAVCLETAHGNGHILVMDDEEVIREIITESLEELGYQVECTEDGSAAIELYRRRQDEGTPFAGVIMDLTIPGGMGGKEAITSLIEINPKVKAVVSSGYASDPVMANFRDYGFSAVLCKPYHVKELSTVIQELLKD
jgi:PAS domain S-box-containing protein